MYMNGMLVTAGEKQRPHAGLWGVNHYVPGRCYDGFTLFSPCWANDAYLVDMRGLVVHSWRVTHSNLAEILPNGNLFTHHCGRWLEELTPASETVWRWEGDETLTAPTHHDFYYVNADHIVTLAARDEPVCTGIYPPRCEPPEMRTDFVLRINRDREIVWEFSFSEHLDELCEMAGLPQPIPYRRRGPSGSWEPFGPKDWAHANTIEVLPDTPLGRRDARFKAGNILFSLRELDTIGIIDPTLDAIVWCYGLGELDGQHQPTMLPNGNILIFDNGTFRGYSVAKEVDPVAGQIVWSFENGADFFSPFRSGVQRLPNGNTLICECDAGHLFEVTADKEIVWSYWSPLVAQGYQHLGKRIHRATRYTAEQVSPVLASRPDVIYGELDAQGNPVTGYAEVIDLYRSW